jgi:hypothetical protein
MRGFTRLVPSEAMVRLLEAAPRATVAFTYEGEVEAIPVAFRFDDRRYLIGLPTGGGGPQPSPREPVKLLVDEGRWFFDLRGIWVRGRLTPAASPHSGMAAPLAWFELSPEKVVAWDYGTMREVPDDAKP